MAHVGQERALGLAGGLRHGPRGLCLGGRPRELLGPLLDPPLELAVVGLDLRIEPGVLDRAGDQVADREQQRPVARLHLAARQPVVDGEDADRSTFRNERRTEERGHAERGSERAVALVRILVGIAEEHRPVGAVEHRQLRPRMVELQLELRHHLRHLGRGADAAAAAQHAASLVREEHHRAVEAQVRHDRLQAAIEELVHLHRRRRQRDPKLVERHELGQPLLEIEVRVLQREVGLLAAVVFALRDLALFEQQRLLAAQLARPPARRAAVQDEPGRQERGRDDRKTDPRRALEQEVEQQRERQGHRDDHVPTGAAAGDRLPGELPFAVFVTVELACRLAHGGGGLSEADQRDRREGAAVRLARVVDVAVVQLGRHERELRAGEPAHDRRAFVRANHPQLGLHVLGGEARQDGVRLADADRAAQLDDRVRDAAATLVEEEVGIARQDPAVLGDEQAELIRVAVALVEQVRRREVVALVLDGGVEHRDEPVEDVGPRPLDERRDLVRIQRLGGLALGLPRDDRLQVADGSDHDAPAAVCDRLAMLVPSERAAAHPAEVDRDLREECGLFGECGHSSPRTTDS